MKSLTAVLLLLTSLGAWAQPNLSEQTEKGLAQILELYRWFHAHPELSLLEKETSQRLAAELRAIGLEVTEEIGGYGVVGVLKGKPGGPVVLYRADMDALPLDENTGLPYTSQNKGVMHACGHDIHMSCAVGTLKNLASLKDQWQGTVLFVGQPAEEVGSGAESMIADPKFLEILAAVGKPSVALALHDNSELLAGQAALKEGFVTANVDSVDITLYGKGGHGAVPSQAVDPVVMGSEVVMALQTIVSRRLPAGTKAVVTVGVFKAGTKRNIIPATAELQLTIRSYEDSTRQKILEELERIAKGVSQAHNASKPPKIYHHAKSYTPAGFNSPDWTKRLQPVFERSLGKEQIIDVPASMVGEDFSEYSLALEIPSVMFLLGTARQGGPKPGLHSDRFAPDPEPTLRAGITLMTGCLLEALRSND
jgi:amidohydrolase